MPKEKQFISKTREHFCFCFKGWWLCRLISLPHWKLWHFLHEWQYSQYYFFFITIFLSEPHDLWSTELLNFCIAFESKIILSKKWYQQWPKKAVFISNFLISLRIEVYCIHLFKMTSFSDIFDYVISSNTETKIQRKSL